MIRGAEVNAANNGGLTALMVAVAHGHADVVKVLIAAGANVSAKDAAGRTAADMAMNDEVKAALTAGTERRNP